MHPGLQEPKLDGGQEVIGQHTQEDMRLRPVCQVMKDRPFHQRTLYLSKRIFDARQQDAGAPDFIRRQVVPIRFQEIAAV